MQKKKNYFPFGFVYPNGLRYDATNPDPGIEKIRSRMVFLNSCYKESFLSGHVFAAAVAKFQKSSLLDVGEFWDVIESKLTPVQVAQVAEAFARDTEIANEPPRIHFPNAIALFDCRFVSTKEWEHIRRYSIGGSEAAAILGKSHFQSQTSLFHEKRDLVIPERTDIGWTHILNYGHAVEDYVVDACAKKIGAHRYPEYRMFAHKKFPFITCNPDAILCFDSGKISLFEAKTAFWMKRTDWKAGIPDYYAPQPRQYLEVLDDPRLTDGFIGVCFGGLSDDIIIHRYMRDTKAGAIQIQAVVDFWQNYIVPGVIPVLSGNSKLDMNALYRYNREDIEKNTECILSEDTLALFNQYSMLDQEKHKLQHLSAEIQKQENSLLLSVQQHFPTGHTVIKSSDPNSPMIDVVISDRKRDTVNTKKLKKDHPEVYGKLHSLSQRMQDDLRWNIPTIKITND